MQTTTHIPSTGWTHASSVLTRLLLHIICHKQPKDGLDSVSFIEAIRCFHTKEPPSTTRPRTARVYQRLCTEYTNLLNALEQTLSEARVEYSPDQVTLTISDQHVSRLYRQFHLAESTRFNDLIHRVAYSFQAIVDQPEPSIQALFISHMPTELIAYTISFLDNLSLLSLSITCRGMRAICFSRLPSKAFFRMKYDMTVVHGPGPRSRESLRLSALEAMIDARNQVVRSMTAYGADPDRREATTFASFENEWDELWPAYMGKLTLIPNALDSHIFGEFYSGIAALLASLPGVTHVRIISLALSGVVADYLASKDRITHLTVVRYASFPGLLHAPSIHHTTPHVTYLGIGFHGDHFSHRHQWRLMTLCPNLRQVYAYAMDGDIEDTTIRFPYAFDELHQIHRLETLHIHGSTCFIESFAMWLRSAAKRHNGPGKLERLKIYSRMGIYHEDVRRLIDALKAHHPFLTTLVLDGLNSTPASLLNYICNHLPSLASLSLVRRATRSQRESRLCQWEEPIYNYAYAAGGFHSLRHLEINVFWTPTTFSPVAIDHLVEMVHERTDDSPTAQNAVRDTELWPLCDGASTAAPFASACPSLESFALRAGDCFYSTRIQRHENGTFRFVDTRWDAPHDRFGNWNPYNGLTW